MLKNGFDALEVPVIDLRDVRSVTDSRRHFEAHLGRLTRKETPLALTVDGRAELVVQDTTGYQGRSDRVCELEHRCQVERRCHA